MVMQMIIVFGGSFNPPTKAHYNMIKTLQTRFAKARIILLPVGDHYPKEGLSDFNHRYDMTKLMTEKFEDVSISDLENQPNYQGTYHSLNQIKREENEEDIAFVIGSDHLIRLKYWINYQKLLEEYPLIVMYRKGHLSFSEAEKLYEKTKHKFIYIDFEYDTSSSLVRNDLMANKDQLDPEVLDYILKNKLYNKEI